MVPLKVFFKINAKLLVLTVFAFSLAVFSFSQDAYAATFTAVQNGPWDDPTTWGGAVPGASDDKMIPVGITVTLSSVVSNSAQFDNYGTITNSGGTIDNNYGTITNYGTIDNNFGTITNYGTINSGGTITNSGGTITNYGTIDNYNFGTINNQFGGTITNSGTITNNFGIIDNYRDAIIANYGTIDNYGTITNSGGTIANNYGTIDQYCDGTYFGNAPTGNPINILCDSDSDGISNNIDNCPAVANPGQEDTDSDGIGNACDTTPNGDTDSDGVDNLTDNCPTVANPGQEDTDSDGIGNVCDTTPFILVNINSVTVTEGNSGTTSTAFTVTLSSPISQTVTVDYTTADDTATAGLDYIANSGSLILAPGETSKSISVPVIGDTADESDETFTISLTNPANAVLGSSPVGTGIILDDDSTILETLYCDNMTIDQLIASDNYNLIDNRGGPSKNLKGTKNADLFLLGDNGDKVQAKDGNDCVIGGAGSDKIVLGKGNDQAFGNGGDDRISGNKGNDVLFGGDGNDTIWGGEGMDTIDAGNGNDRVYANQDNDTVYGGMGDDWIGAGLGDDTVSGGDGNDKIFGRPGSDSLNGDAGNDMIHGGQGNDHLNGGSDADQCYGAQGANTFTDCEVTKGQMAEEDDSDEGPEDE